MHVLVTRPTGAANATLRELKRLGHTVSHAPLLHVETVDSALPEGEFDGVILTSANAVAPFANGWKGERDVSIYVTGAATEDAVRKAGFENCMSVEGGARDIIAHLTAQTAQPHHILYPRAEQVAHDLSTMLKADGIVCADWVVYRTTAATDLNETLSDDLVRGHIDAVLLYSPRTARIFAHLAPDDMASSIQLFALSQDIAMALGEPLAGKCRFPSRPTQHALLALLGD